MNIKKWLIALFIFLLVFALGLAGFIYFQRSRNIVTSQPASIDQQIPQIQVTRAERGRSLLDLVEAVDKPTACNFQSFEGTTATMFFAPVMGKYAFSDSPDRPAQNVLVKDGSAYVWTEGNANGYVMDAALLASNSLSISGISLDMFYTIDPEDLDCKDVKLIEAIYEIPAEVSFQEFKI